MEGGSSSSPFPNHQRFFRVLLPGFDDKLPLPLAFSSGRCKSSKATLVSPSGGMWHVEILSCGGNRRQLRIFFGGEGWRGFSRRHGLEVGYFLVFHHHGEMVFTFSIFDLSTCEISSYPSSGNSVERPVVHCSCDFGQRTRFERTITHHNLEKSYVYIPMEFKRSVGLTVGEQVTLVDPEGRLWFVIVSCKPSKKEWDDRVHFGRGWLDFVVGNKLEKGDRVSFELESGGERKLLKVKIDKRSEN